MQKVDWECECIYSEDSVARIIPTRRCSYKWGKSSEHFGDRYEGCFINVCNMKTLFTYHSRNISWTWPSQRIWDDLFPRWGHTLCNTRHMTLNCARSKCVTVSYCRANIWMERWKAKVSGCFKMDLASQAHGKMICYKGMPFSWARWMQSERQCIRLTRVWSCLRGSLIAA